MQRLEDLDDQEQFGALNQGYNTQHEHLREQVRKNAKIHGALTPVDGVLLDNLTNSINGAEHHCNKSCNEESYLGEGPSTCKNKILQGFVCVPVCFFGNIRFSIGVSFEKSDDTVTINRSVAPMSVNT